MSGYILLLDDSPHILQLLVAILREHGYQVHPANSGARTVSMAVDHITQALYHKAKGCKPFSSQAALR